jgi:hypothetical protein
MTAGIEAAFACAAPHWVPALRAFLRRWIPTALALRANKSETFDCLKFTLEGAGELSDGNARTSAHALACRA